MPVKGPEAGSVLALPLLMDWLDQAHGARLLGFLPTMYKARRGEVRQWLERAAELADQRGYACVPADRRPCQPGVVRLDGHPYAPLATAVEEVLQCRARLGLQFPWRRLPRSRRAVAPVQDRLVLVPSPTSSIRARATRGRDDGIDELAESIRAHGLLQPIVVRPLGTGYELIAGHRRLEAAQALGWTEIAAVVRDETDDNEAYILTLVENLQREDLSPKEEAAALEVLVRERGWSTRQVAARRSSAGHVRQPAAARLTRMTSSRRSSWQQAAGQYQPRSSLVVADIQRRIHVAPDAVPHTRLVSDDRGRKRPRCATRPTRHRVVNVLRAPAHQRPRLLRRCGPGGPRGCGAYRWVTRGRRPPGHDARRRWPATVPGAPPACEDRRA